ncbi:type II toxin-antitoxin system RelE/ParE family toxin [Fibrobacter sp. UWEL]|uniref:type II toxin-antitoxin system RelE/ParE family toxin n=1 Tax=Fibrobacter sp. UWEL TaxID=1896209 RepID=UPI0009113D93|nr:type II toxin-antitoxin system RelE/ParE family toxin [Fibrobacter sp. UWEL]SHL22461.1 putative addiction module killer protein [Fibrobacter sp. UWEL]
MYTVEKTEKFLMWYQSLKDVQAKQRIFSRLVRIELGNLGDVKSVGEGVFEIRIDCGPGYRIYYAMRGQTVILLLCGGDKSSQQRDVESAKLMWKGLENESK